MREPTRLASELRAPRPVRSPPATGVVEAPAWRWIARPVAERRMREPELSVDVGAEDAAVRVQGHDSRRAATRRRDQRERERRPPPRLSHGASIRCAGETPMRATVTAAVAALALGASATAAGWPGRPPRPSPAVAGAGAAPPPTWVESHSRSWWLAFSSYCWTASGRAACADFLPPQSRRDLPVVRVARGTTVRLHFGVVPSEVHATLFQGLSLKHVRLRPGAVVSWRPARSGVFSVDIRGSAGSASYVGRLQLS
jgi:hypothetical protein